MGHRGTKTWVREFAARLRADGIDVTLDQWHRVILDGITIKEVKDVHRETLLVVVDRVNELIAEYEAKKQRRAEAEAAKVASHKAWVTDPIFQSGRRIALHAVLTLPLFTKRAYFLIDNRQHEWQADCP